MKDRRRGSLFRSTSSQVWSKNCCLFWQLSQVKLYIQRY